MAEHFLNPEAEAHARRTDEILDKAESGELNKAEAGKQLFEHVFGRNSL